MPNDGTNPAKELIKQEMSYAVNGTVNNHALEMKKHFDSLPIALQDKVKLLFSSGLKLNKECRRIKADIAKLQVDAEGEELRALNLISETLPGRYMNTDVANAILGDEHGKR